MEKLGLPIALAAALHGVVLFGFNQKSPKVTPPKEITVVTQVDLRPPPEELDPIVLSGDASAASAPDREVLRPPSTPEPAAQLSDSMFIMEKQHVRVDVAIDPNMRNIVPPTGPIGNGDGPFKPGNIIPSTMLDRVPAARLQGQPIYPFEAKRNGVSGQVMVDFTVNERGDVVEARAVSSSDRVFEEAATRAVLKWKFEPGRRNGGVVPFRMVIPIQFSLND